MNIRTGPRGISLFAFAFCTVLGTAPAWGQIDVTNRWMLQIENPFFAGLVCQVDIVQTGTSVSVVDVAGNCGGVAPLSLSGSIDTGTGVFSVSGTANICTTLTISGTASAGSDALSGTYNCNGGLFGPFSGSLCNNGNLDPGEDCDSGTFGLNDCCSGTCQFEAPGEPCYDLGDGNSCTNEVCAAGGVCTHPIAPAGQQCDDEGNYCTDNVCDAGGTCTHPAKPAGIECNADFNVCTDDSCDGGGNCIATNNTASCWDGNDCTVDDTCSGGVCVPGPAAASGARCDADNNICSLDQCDGAGTCVAGICSLCCRPTILGCVPEVDACTSPIAPAAQIKLREGFPADDDQLTWKWKEGGATNVSEFGDPLTGTSYELCIYETTPTGGDRLRYSSVVDAGGTCGSKPCWRARGTKGFGYTNKSAAPQGIQIIRLSSGAAGDAKILVKGRGSSLEVPELSYDPLDVPVTVQLKASNGSCWGSVFSTSPGNSSTFKAKDGH